IGNGNVAPAPLIKVVSAAVAAPAIASSANRILFIVAPCGMPSDRWGCINRRWRPSDRTATSSGRDRQADPEAAAPPPALDADLTALGLHEVLDDGQPEARAAGLPRAASVRAVEPLEDPLAVPGLDAGPGVDHGEDRELASAVSEDGDVPAVRSELDRVVEQVDEDLLQRAPVRDHAQGGGPVVAEDDLLLPRAGPDQIQRGLAERAHLDGTRLGTVLPRFQPGEVEEVARQARQAVGMPGDHLHEASRVAVQLHAAAEEGLHRA